MQIKFLNPLITRKPKLRRQRKIFRQQGKMPRADQMNINVATWGRLLKKNINMTKSNLVQEPRGLESDPMAGRKCWIIQGGESIHLHGAGGGAILN